MKCKNLCTLNCPNKEKCNKRFAKRLETINEKAVYIYAKCGRFFRVVAGADYG